MTKIQNSKPIYDLEERFFHQYLKNQNITTSEPGTPTLNAEPLNAEPSLFIGVS
jgi:hypothetical protein